MHVYMGVCVCVCVYTYIYIYIYIYTYTHNARYLRIAFHQNCEIPLAFTFEQFSLPFRVTANTLSKMRNREGTWLRYSGIRRRGK